MRAELCALTILTGFVLPCAGHSVRAEGPRPNILWITCEDISPNLGCYGDAYAVTPNLDRLATQGVRYTHAFAPIGVCAPSRSCIITGMYPPSIGTQHMRCNGTLPEGVKCYSEILREAGYYCTNNSKTDYNFRHPARAWNESSAKAHWRNRQPGQPFFAIFNFTTCHESQIRLSEPAYQQRTAEFTAAERHDPAKAVVPPYHPDTPEVRRDWARYADMITFMDKQVGGVLKELEDDGLAEDTIVFYYSDHGAGMPRSKRWLYDSSTRVPFMIRTPQKFAHLAPGNANTISDRLISFVDLAPSLFSLTGVKIPDYLQGQAFLGPEAKPPRQYVYGYRDRMDERYDMIRSVRDARFKYIRNYMPQLPYFHHQHIDYMFAMPTMRAWQQLADAGKLTGAAAVFMAESKPIEELYDTQTDPYEVKNLASLAEHGETLARMRAAHRHWQRQVLDLGLMPEGDLRSRFGGGAEYDAVRKNPSAYPIERIAAAADLANSRQVESLAKLTAVLKDEDPAVRYWGAIGIGAIGQPAESAASVLRSALKDSAGTVRVAAADALCRVGQPADAVPQLIQDFQHENEWVRLQAANILDRLDGQANSAREVLQRGKTDSNQYVVRVVEHALLGLDK